jgi:ribosomal protein S18 acetylase RimI-like enzyme
MKIEAITQVTDELVEAIGRLLPQLSSNVRTPSHADLAEVVGSSRTSLLVARDEGGRIVGTLTLFVTATPSKVFCFVEDVVVDESARGHGVGEALVTEALRIAADRGATQTELHSGNHRQPAIRLYERVGFKRFDTNVFRYRHAPRG